MFQSVYQGSRFSATVTSVELIDDPEIAQRDIHRLAIRYHGEEQAAKQVAEQFSKEQRVTLHLKCDRVHEYL